MRNDRELDQIVDAALPAYSATEPRPGLEQRILARSLAEPPRQRPWFLKWAIVVPEIASLLLIVLLTLGPYLPRKTVFDAKAPITPPIAVPAHQVQPATPWPTAQPRSASRSVRATSTRNPLPKQPVFPTPSPLTAEEVAMIALTRAQAQMPLRTAEADVEIPEMHIAEFEIKPLPTLADQKLGPSATLSAPTEQQP